MKRHMLILMVILLHALTLMTACGPAALSVGAPDRSEPAEISDGQATGLDRLIGRIRDQGFAVEVPGEAIEQPFFSVSGQLIRVNGQDLQIFAYESETVAQAEAELVSDDGSAIGTNMVSWMASPHFYRDRHFIVFYVGDEAETLDMLGSVLGDPFAGRTAQTETGDIEQAVLDGLRSLNADVTGATIAVEEVLGDYAYTTVSTSHGGFSAYVKRDGAAWTLLTQGSAFNPEELRGLGIPESLIP